MSAAKAEGYDAFAKGVSEREPRAGVTIVAGDSGGYVEPTGPDASITGKAANPSGGGDAGAGSGEGVV